MPQQDADYKKKTGLAIFKQNINIPTENHPAMGMLGAGSIGTGVARAGSGLLKSVLRKIIPSPAAIKNVTARPITSPGLARIQQDLEFLRTSKPAARPAPGDMRARVKSLARNQELGAIASSGRPAPSYRGLSDKNKSDIKGVVKAVKTKDAAASDARSTVMRDRVKGLARQAELGAIKDKKAAMAKGTSSTSSYTAPAGVGPKAPVVGKGGRNQVTPAGQAAFEKATGKSMFGSKGEGMPLRQRAMWVRKNQGK